MKAERAHPTVPYKTRAGHRALMSGDSDMSADELPVIADNTAEEFHFDKALKDVETLLQTMKPHLSELRRDVADVWIWEDQCKNKIRALRADKNRDNNLLAFFLAHGHHMFRAPKHKKRRAKQRARLYSQGPETLP